MKHKNAIVIQSNGGPFDMAMAAMIMRGLKFDAEVIVSERHGLVAVLEREGMRFSRVFLINVEFCGDEKRAENVLRALKGKNIALEFANNGIGRNQGALSRQLHELGLFEFFTADGMDLQIPECVEKRYGVKVRDLCDMAEFVWDGRYCVASVPYLEIKETAKWFFDNYGRSDLFTHAVQALARQSKLDELPPVLMKSVEHWRLFRRRGLAGNSEIIRDLREKILHVAQFPDARVMILGESGTGKETVAMQLHYGSSRRDKKFVAFNCATVNAELLESRLFGHEKGAFTGADKQTKGLFEEADGGTLFLDEIGELKLELQGILLRAIEEGRIMRVGGTDEIPVDVRLMTATNRDLPAMVRDGKFRADLYQRLAVVQIVVPPLRAHKEDICDIVHAWYSLRLKPNERCGDEPTDEQIAALMDYDYPGNVRELLNVLDRSVVLGEKDWVKLMAEHRSINANMMPLKPIADDAPMKSSGGIVTLDAAVRAYVKQACEKCGKNITKTAEVLDVSRNTIRKYI